MDGPRAIFYKDAIIYQQSLEDYVKPVVPINHYTVARIRLLPDGTMALILDVKEEVEQLKKQYPLQDNDLVEIKILNLLNPRVKT